MTKKTMTSLFSIAAITVLTIGCGSSSATPKNNTTVLGTVIDDYIQGATVCVDKTPLGTYQVSTDLPCATTKTNATGQYVFATDVSASPLIMTGGKDVASKKAFTGVYTAPAGSTILSPLTTIVQSILLNSNGSVSIADAQATVKTSLGLSSDVDLTSYDPIAKLKDPATVEEAKTIFAQQTSIQTILTSIAATIAASVPGTTTAEANVSYNAATAIATLMTSSPDVNVTSTSGLTTIINATATATTDANVTDSFVASIAGQVEVTTSAITENIENSTSTDLETIRTSAAQIATLVQTSVKTVTDDIESGTSLEDIASNLVIPTVAEITTAAQAVTTVATNLTTVATTETQPVVTGAEGGN